MSRGTQHVRRQGSGALHAPHARQSSGKDEKGAYTLPKSPKLAPRMPQPAPCNRAVQFLHSLSLTPKYHPAGHRPTAPLRTPLDRSRPLPFAYNDVAHQASPIRVGCPAQRRRFRARQRQRAVHAAAVAARAGPLQQRKPCRAGAPGAFRQGAHQRHRADAGIARCCRRPRARQLPASAASDDGNTEAVRRANRMAPFADQLSVLPLFVDRELQLSQRAAAVQHEPVQDVFRRPQRSVEL